MGEESSPHWCACSAVSTRPKRRCTTPFGSRPIAGRSKARHAIQPAGSCRWAASGDRPHPARRGMVRMDESLRQSRLLPTRPLRATSRSRWKRPVAVDFTCCHPSLGEEAQVALTLREICGLPTETIARAMSTKPTTLAQRIVRAKAKSATPHSYRVPDADELGERLAGVSRVVYLIFDEGYAPSLETRSPTAAFAGGHSAGAVAARPDAATRDDRPPRADAPESVAADGARDRGRGIHQPGRSRIARFGINPPLPKPGRWRSRRCDREAPRVRPGGGDRRDA